MRRAGLVVGIVCVGLSGPAIGAQTDEAKPTVVLTGCMQAEPRPASPSGRPVLIVTNVNVNPDDSPAAGSPSGTTFVLQGGKPNLSKYIGKRVKIRATLVQAAQRTPTATGTSGSSQRAEMKSDEWPRARVKEIHSVGTCEK